MCCAGGCGGRQCGSAWTAAGGAAAGQRVRTPDLPEPESSERVLRHRHEAVEAILNELDSAQRAPERFDARRFDRQPCRDVVPVMIDQPNGERIRYAVYTRNISPSGMSFLVGHFVYTGQHCQVNLRDARGDWLTVDGVIRRCRYLPGTRSLHEVGVEFYDVFDVAVLEERQRPRTCSNVLVAESDPAAHAAITRLFDDVQVESRCVTSAAVLLTAAQESYYDLIIIDVDLPDADGLGIVERLRGGRAIASHLRPGQPGHAAHARDLRGGGVYGHGRSPADGGDDRAHHQRRSGRNRSAVHWRSDPNSLTWCESS